MPSVSVRIPHPPSQGDSRAQLGEGLGFANWPLSEAATLRPGDRPFPVPGSCGGGLQTGVDLAAQPGAPPQVFSCFQFGGGQGWMPESLDAVGEARLFGGRPLPTRRGLWPGGSVGRARRALSGNRVWGAPCTWSHSKSGSTLSNVLKGRGPLVWWTQAPPPPPPAAAAQRPLPHLQIPWIFPAPTC